MNINISVNEININLPENSTLKDIMDKFFRARCEFIININSESVQSNKFETILLKENDKLQIIAYSRHSYSQQRRTIFKEEKEETK